MSTKIVRCVLALVLLAAAVPVVYGQGMLTLPVESQAASVGQRVALTDVTISYHRPMVKGRKIFGGLVPYGQIWRAGANENTTIEFADDVMIEGKPLAKGVYGLHMVPGENEWQVAFSKSSTAWGSYTYDPKEDALRVAVKPKPAEFHEYLTYIFDDVKPESAVATLVWDKTAVPFKIEVSPKVTEARIADALRGRVHWQWEAYDDAANYLLQHKGNMVDAVTYANRSVELQPHFQNLFTQSQVLEAVGKRSEAEAALAKALPIANQQELYQLARWQQRHGQGQQGVATLKQAVQKDPNHWIAHLAQARIHSSEKNFAQAQKEMEACMAAAPDELKNDLKPLQARLQKNEDINQ